MSGPRNLVIRDTCCVREGPHPLVFDGLTRDRMALDDGWPTRVYGSCAMTLKAAGQDWLPAPAYTGDQRLNFQSTP